ncbi:hypothetical protein [Arthrobacter sp.]|uniref:hypothetical protein n=1 Tax=Arthrobacter sp. TaxID=1667 RepID=UPI00281144C3|nr:hypothetical protein [Arthrobacter sp.]
MRQNAQDASTAGAVFSGQASVDLSAISSNVEAAEHDVDMSVGSVAQLGVLPEPGGVCVGDTAVLFGDPGTGASADDWGAAIGSHGDEIINRIAPRLPRAYECRDYEEFHRGAPNVA